LIFSSADLAKPALRALASLVIAGSVSWVSTNSHAADLLTPYGDAFVAPVAAVPSGWQFRVTPYAWAPSVSGDITVRGHTADIDFSFWDLFDSGSSGAELDSLAALMGYIEVRKGPWGIYGDVVWGKFDFSGSAVTQRNPIANLKLSARANAGLDYEITMAESGLTYEVASWAGTHSSTALDLLGGARYWNQQLDLSLAVDASVDLGNLGLERSGSRAVARSGTLEWVDPFVGLRVRHQLAPGKELQFLGDIGGFAVGSDLTWQLFGGYSFDFAVWQATLHGIVGYRALAVDYSQDGAAGKNNLDLILHGPVVGLSFRW
jgi:hypothetical protein